ncbi:MAG: ABC transporter ATP-binding protein/permease [Oscillospiraceae bacterium]|nr:ABC transporter ATP-binding protein/permease [Oscillospiraceae bacterium]
MGPGGRPPGGGGMRRFGPMSEEEKAQAPKITKALIKRALSYLWPYKPQLFIILLTLAVSVVFATVPTLISGEIINVFADPNAPGYTLSLGSGLYRIFALIILSLVVLVISNLISVLQSYVSTWMSQHIMFDMRNQMYTHIQYMSQRFFTNERQGDIITRMTSDISGVNGVISGTLQQLFSNIITLVVTVVMLLAQNWILAIVGVLIVPLFIIPTRIVGQKRFKLAGEQQEKQDEMNQILNETLSVSGSLLVKLFVSEKREYNKFENVNGEVVKLAVKESVIGRWFMMTMGIFQSFGPMLIYLAAALIMFHFDPKDVVDPITHLTVTVNGMRDLNVGMITIVTGLMGRLLGPVNALFNMQIDITRSMALFDRIFQYFDRTHEITNKPDAKPVPTVRGDIEFSDVRFHYNPETEILKGVNFSVKAGETIALVGPSGAGKSTVINLIPRLYDVVSGSVKIDGQDLRDVDMFDLRRNIGLVTQDTYLFNGSIRDNLLYANPEATERELIEACKKANIYDFVERQPQGLDTIVGNRGLKLSGGEKQRISIARVILKDPKILILDEATSSLDSISEALIQEAITPLLTGRTSVVIAHRLSTIMEADHIVVLKSGTVQGIGTHRELLDNNDTYRELYETQFKRAIDDYVASNS